MVFVLRDGSIYFNKVRTRPELLPDKIRESLGHGAEKKIYIRADARVRYSTVQDVLDGIRSAGVEKVSFLADQRRSASSDAPHP